MRSEDGVAQSPPLDGTRPKTTCSHLAALQLVGIREGGTVRLCSWARRAVATRGARPKEKISKGGTQGRGLLAHESGRQTRRVSYRGAGGTPTGFRRQSNPATMNAHHVLSGLAGIGRSRVQGKNAFQSTLETVARNDAPRKRPHAGSDSCYHQSDGGESAPGRRAGARLPEPPLYCKQKRCRPNEYRSDPQVQLPPGRRRKLWIGRP
jgi:hypothetical protein